MPTDKLSALAHHAAAIRACQRIDNCPCGSVGTPRAEGGTPLSGRTVPLATQSHWERR